MHASEAPIDGGSVQGDPRTILRIEGLTVLAAAVAAYAMTGGGWLLFAALFLVPDLSMLGYLAGPRVGAMIYNLGHTLVAPAAIAAVGALAAVPVMLAIAAIWAAHIGFDRAAGYGLKYPDAFGHTHLGLPFRGSAHAPSSRRSFAIFSRQTSGAS